MNMSVGRCRLCVRLARQYSAAATFNSPSASDSASSAAQPLSTPMTPAPPRAKKEKPVKSACAAGTIFKGLNIMKAGQDPVALAESDYPPFLWKLLDRSDIGEKKEARSVNRAQIKRKNFFSGKL